MGEQRTGVRAASGGRESRRRRRLSKIRTGCQREGASKQREEVCVCVCVCVRACVRARARVCVCVWVSERASE